MCLDFINKIKILLISLIPILNKNYMNIQKELTIHFGSQPLTLFIDSMNQEYKFSVRQIMNYIVPLISLDFRLKTKIFLIKNEYTQTTYTRQQEKNIK